MSTNRNIECLTPIVLGSPRLLPIVEPSSVNGSVHVPDAAVGNVPVDESEYPLSS